MRPEKREKWGHRRVKTEERKSPTKMATAEGEEAENHMGCMAGFFHIFERPHILSPKRFSSPRRLPPSLNLHSQPPSENNSPLVSKEFCNHKLLNRSSTMELLSPAPEPPAVAAENITRSPFTLPIMEFKEGSRSPWKFSKEAPRLSLDSRAVVDAKGSLKPRQIRPESAIPPANRRDSTEGDSQRRSPSVIVRLMGLEPLSTSDPEQSHKAELRRSASESRVNTEYRFYDAPSFHLQQSQNLHSSVSIIPFREEKSSNGDEDLSEFPKRSDRVHPARQQRCVVRRKSFFDSTDFFPESKHLGSVPGDLEKRTRMRSVDEHPSDLDTLNQLLETLRLKGLLHTSTNQQNQFGNKNPAFDNRATPVKSARSPGYLCGSRDSSPLGLRSATAGVASPSVSPRRDRATSSGRDQNRGRSMVSPTRSDNSMKISNKRAAAKETPEHQRRVSSAHSPKVNTWRRPELVQTARRTNRRGGAIREKDECSMFSKSSSIITCSEADEEVEEYNREGKSLLERCDKLLHSIAEMTAAAAAATESQPSPVSVLDSSLYHEESSPSPVMKRSLEFMDQPTESEDEAWGSVVSSPELRSEDPEFIYISAILRASNYLPEHSDIFSLLEKQEYLKGKAILKGGVQERRLIFDTVQEMMDRRRQMAPWRAVGENRVEEMWSEYEKIRERRWSWEKEGDLAGVVCGALRRDLAEEARKGWGDGDVELSEVVLYMERLIFKDLIGETITHLASTTNNNKTSNRTESLRRTLLFF